MEGIESCGVWREHAPAGGARRAGVVGVRPRRGAGQRPFKLRSSLWGSWEASGFPWGPAAGAVVAAGQQRAVVGPGVQTRPAGGKDGPKNAQRTRDLVKVSVFYFIYWSL